MIRALETCFRKQILVIVFTAINWVRSGILGEFPLLLETLFRRWFRSGIWPGCNWLSRVWGGESRWIVLYGTRINPDGVCPNGEHVLLPLFGARVVRTQDEGATIKCPVFYWTRGRTRGLYYRSHGYFLSINCPGKTLNSTYTCYSEVSVIESIGAFI